MENFFCLGRVYTRFFFFFFFLGGGGGGGAFSDVVNSHIKRFINFVADLTEVPFVCHLFPDWLARKR